MRIQKIPLLMLKILKCCSPRCKFWKFRGGGGLDPPPDTPSRSAPEPTKSKILRQHFIYWDSFLNTIYNHLLDTVSLRGSNFKISYMLDVYNGRIDSRYVWNAVLTYIQLFEDIFKSLKISSNELKISLNIWRYLKFI